jgi:hypothetical protein
MGFLSALTGSDVGKATMSAAADNKNLINGFQTNANLLNDTAENRSQLQLDRGIINFQPWVDSGKAANGMYSNALGLNGAAGNEAATGAFQAGPGYQFAVDQSLQAALRGASAGGNIASGNTLAALQDRGNGLADQEFGSWLDRLNGQSQVGLGAAGQQQQGYNNSAGLIQDSNGTRLGIESGVLQGIMGQNNQIAQAKEQQTAAKGSFLGGLLKGGVGLATKAASGGLF